MRGPGHVEIIEQGEGLTYLGGWVQLPAGLAEAGTARLRLTPEGQPPLERALRRTVPRPDLPEADGQPAGRGFHILLRDLPPWTSACAELLLGEEALPLGPEIFAPRPFQPRGHIGAANRFGVAGWLLDLPGARPVLLVDDRFEVALPLDQHRPDLPFDDGTDQPLFGFRLSLSALGEALRARDPGVAIMDGRARSCRLMSGGVEVSEQVLRVSRGMDGALELAIPGKLEGWGAEPEPGGEVPSLDLMLDGTRWCTVQARAARPDLREAGIGTRIAGGACQVELPWRNPGDGAALHVALRPAHAAHPLQGAREVDLPPWRPDRGGLLDTLPAGGQDRVAIIVPVFNAPADLERCVAAVLAHTTGPARLILVDDASTDPAVEHLLAKWEGLPGVEVHRNATNLGFAGTVNRGVELAGRDDVVLLNADTAVGPGWLDGLRLAAHATPRIGTVTAVSNNAGAFSVPEFDTENHPPEWFGAADLARLARQAALALWPEVPTGNGFCLYVRRACLDAVGSFDAAAFPRGYGEENDFCMRAGRAGFTHVVDDRTLVWHRRSASFGETRHPHIRAGRQVLAERYPEYGLLVRAFRDDPAFMAIRWRMRRALQASQRGATLPRPRVLFVLSSRSGGTPQTNRDLMESLADRYEPWTLHSDGRELVLARHGAAGEAEHHRLASPMQPATHRSSEYDRRLADMLLRHGFELVHVRHLAWHGLGLPEVCRRLGIPVVFSFHDFYTVCPTIKLLDAEGRHCAGACTQGEGDCVPELWDPATMPPLRDRFVHRWREMMAGVLEACDAFVTTSPGARDLLAGHFPALGGGRIRLIQHGRSFARMAALVAEPMPEEPLRVLVPGNISAAKGGLLVAAMAALDTGREVEFHLLGAVDGSLREPRPGVVLHGRYDRDDFAERVREIRPHLGAVLSVWPETYCHTLTECWAAGLPVLGTRLGAVAERIGAHGGGWLIDHTTPPAAVLAFLRELRHDLAGLRARRDEVLDWQRNLGRHYDAPAMAVEYDLLYREVLEARRSFAAAAPAAPPQAVMAVERPGAPLPPRNRPFGQLMLRRGQLSHPFGADGAGRVDAVLVQAGAARASELPDLLGRAGAAGVRLLLEADAAIAGALAEPPLRDQAAEAQRAGLLRLISAAPALDGRLRAAGFEVWALPVGLEPGEWPPHAATEDSTGPLRLVTFEEAPLPAQVMGAFGDLAALGVVEHVPHRGPASPAVLQSLAGGLGAVALPDPALQGRAAALALAAAAAGLPVLRLLGAGEAAGADGRGAWLVPADAGAWVGAVAELSVDPPRRAALAGAGRRAAAATLGLPGPAAVLGRLLSGPDAPDLRGIGLAAE